MAQVVMGLRPDVVIDLFHHGDCLKAEKDFDRKLSEAGMVQATRLSKLIGGYDVVLTSGAPRTKETAVLAANGGALHFGQGRELYGPINDADFDALEKMTGTLVEKGLDPYLYRLYLDLDTGGVFDRFKTEAVSTILGKPGIFSAGKIAIFSHAILSNAIAEALFPQHREVLLELKLGPCEGIRVSATTCEHIQPLVA